MEKKIKKRNGKKPTGSLKIEPSVYARLKDYCDNKNLRINGFVSSLVDKELSK